MSLVISEEQSESKYPTIPLGVSKARCVSVIDLGTQEIIGKEKYLGKGKCCLNGKFQSILTIMASH